MGDKPKKVYLDISIGGEDKGKIIIQLFSKECPITCENFLKLCTGSCGYSKASGKQLSYKGSIIHRVIPGFMMQGGDITHQNGTGGESIYGQKFKDEGFSFTHDKEGLVSMANKGPHTNSSQFFITFRASPWLDGKHVVFGKVIEGDNVWKMIEDIDTNHSDKPLKKVAIKDCGIYIPTRNSSKEKDKKTKNTKKSTSTSPKPRKSDKKEESKNKPKVKPKVAGKSKSTSKESISKTKRIDKNEKKEKSTKKVERSKPIRKRTRTPQRKRTAEKKRK